MLWAVRAGVEQRARSGRRVETFGGGAGGSSCWHSAPGCSGNAAGLPPPRNLACPALAALGASSPRGTQRVMGLFAPLAKAGSAGWRVGMICSFSV